MNGRIAACYARRAFKQGSIISRWSASKRSYTEKPLPLQQGTAKPKIGLENPEQLAQDGAVENATQGLHILPEHEDRATDTPKPSARRPLPLSPLMDPSYLAAKQRHRLPKAEPSKEPTPFQQQLAKNPYGMISRLS
jgi:hypothetical protein